MARDYLKALFGSKIPAGLGRGAESPDSAVADEVEAEDLSPSQKPFSIAALLLANLVPLYGVLFLDWSLFSVMFLYWMESAIIGFYNVPRMIVVGGVLGVFFSIFFAVHYGGFMFGHLVFILALFGPKPFDLFHMSPAAFLDGATMIAFFLLLISHGVSFFSNFIGRNEYQRTTLPKLMMSPYKRIVIMHLTIIFGGFVTMFLGAPPAALVLMVVLKIAVDLGAHLKERSTFGRRAVTT